MKKIIPFSFLLLLVSCSIFYNGIEKKEGFKMITAIGNIESRTFKITKFESKGLLDARYDIEIYAIQDSIRTERSSTLKFYKKRPKRSYVKLSLINSVEIIEHLNSEFSDLSEYIKENQESEIVTDVYVFMNSQESKKILNADATFLNKTQEGIYRVKTVTGDEVGYIPLNQKNIFDFKSEKFCVMENYYESKIISIGEGCKSKNAKKTKKVRYDRL
jgi:hypothetical protein